MHLCMTHCGINAACVILASRLRELPGALHVRGRVEHPTSLHSWLARTRMACPDTRTAQRHRPASKRWRIVVPTVTHSFRALESRMRLVNTS